MISALIGQPPITVDDYYIVKGILRLFGSDADPAKGVLIPPIRPPNAQFETRGPQIIGVNAMCIVLVIALTGSRLSVRALKRGLRWGWDDSVIMLAAIVIVTWFSLVIAKVGQGALGKHMWSLTYYQFYTAQKLNTASALLYPPATCLIQISITIFNRRITGLVSRAWLLINNVLLCIIAIYMISYTLFIGLNCPAQHYSLIKVGKLNHYTACSRNERPAIALGALHVVLDFCLLSTPIIVLWKVKMARSRKIGPIIIFLFGSVSCLGAMMIPIMEFRVPRDPSFVFLNLEVWLILDLLFGSIVASLPIVYGSLPKAWRDFEIFTRSYFRGGSSSQTPNLPESSSKSNQTPIGPYHDLESKSDKFRIESDTEFELLERREREMFDIGKKAASQQSRDESPL